MARSPSSSKASNSDFKGPTVSTHSKDKSILTRCFEAIHSSDDDLTKSLLSQQLRQLISAENIQSEVLILHDEGLISDFHADQLYAAASRPEISNKPILLILHSPGGSIEPAYLISKALKRLSNNSFKVAVPRKAKSAATLLALGADEIHMGLMSQLGPIDPQFGGLPALALANALDVVADVTCRFPASTEMFTKYLANQIQIRHLGYFQRINESAVQYAERLLADKVFPQESMAESIAQRLVNHYKDHSFVIDADEAKDLLGEQIIKEGTPEYRLSDTIFKLLDLVSFFLDDKNKQFKWVGAANEAGAHIWAKQQPSSS